MNNTHIYLSHWWTKFEFMSQGVRKQKEAKRFITPGLEDEHLPRGDQERRPSAPCSWGWRGWRPPCRTPWRRTRPGWPSSANTWRSWWETSRQPEVGVLDKKDKNTEILKQKSSPRKCNVKRRRSCMTKVQKKQSLFNNSSNKIDGLICQW